MEAKDGMVSRLKWVNEPSEKVGVVPRSIFSRTELGWQFALGCIRGSDQGE